jgi:phytoene synthase
MAIGDAALYTGPMAGDEEQYCARMVRDADRERWLCALFAPDRVRPAMLALLAFNLEVARARDAVREPHMALIRLQWWREALEACAAGSPRRHPVCLALAPVLAATPAIAPLLASIVDAREQDAVETPFAATAGLLAYADATGGALAQAMAYAIGVEDPRAIAAAAALGRGWSLAGLLLAAPQLAQRRWCPLPEASLERHGVDREAWLAGRPGSGGAAAVAEISGLARDAFASVGRAEAGALGLGLGGLRVLGRAHLRRIARADNDVFAPMLAAPMHAAALRLAVAWLARRW